MFLLIKYCQKQVLQLCNKKFNIAVVYKVLKGENKMGKNGKKGKVILGIGLVLLVIIIAIITLCATNKINISLFGAKAEDKNEGFTINQAFGDGTVTGEIVLGGTSSGYDGKAYANGLYTNGYCVNHGANLYGTYVSGQVLNTYNSAYAVNNAKSGCAGQIRWLLDNMLRMNLTNTGRAETVVSAEEIAFYRQNLKNILTKQGKSAGGLDSLTDTQIFQVQQYVLWQYTSNVSTPTPAWKNNASDGRAELYAALIAEANTHSNYTVDGTEYMTMQKDGSYKMVQEGNNVLIGPINISNPTGKQYFFNYSNFTIDGSTAGAGNNVKVFQSNKTTEINNNSYINYDGQLYVRIYNYQMSKLNYTYNCSGTINATTYQTNAKYWEKSGLQSVITFSRNSKPQSITADAQYFKKGEVDLALKKMIVTVDGTRVEKSNGFNVDRHNGWNVDVSPLNKGGNNANYTMNKTPVEVKKGQTIDYQIRIYNEGQVKAKALEINDYIPVGLKVEKVFYKNNTELTTTTSNANYYTHNPANGILNVRLGDAALINAFNGTNVEYDYITVRCSVKDDATGILTNVAEIRKYQIESGEITVDRDSTADNWNTPTGEPRTAIDKGCEQWRNYANAQQNLLDGNWHIFVAQDSSISGKKGDDDDFEKVKVLEEYKLTIKKVDASGNGIDDIKFNITQLTYQPTKGKYSTFIDENTSTHDSIIEYTGIIKDGIDESLPYLQFSIEEIPTGDGKWIQLDKPLMVSLYLNDGQVSGYMVTYNGNIFGGRKTTSQTFTCTTSNGAELEVKVNLSGNNVEVEIENILSVPGNYGLRLRKVSSGDGLPLEGVTFTAVKSNCTSAGVDLVPGTNIDNLNPTDENGYTNILTQTIDKTSVNLIDKYVITEIDLGENAGYTKLESDITVQAYKRQLGDSYAINYWMVRVGTSLRTLSAGGTGELYITENGINYKILLGATEINGVQTLTITVPNAPDNQVPLQIRKVSAEDTNTVIQGTSFKISRGENILYEDIDLTGLVTLTDNLEANANTIEYKVEEISAADGYDNMLYGKYVKLSATLVAGVPTTVTAKVFNADDTENTELSAIVSANVVDVDVQGTMVKTIDLQIQNPETEKIIDLALKKVITEVDGTEVKTANGFEENFDRLTEGTDKLRIDTTPLKNGEFDAEYYLNKTPIEVLKYSKVKYQIRIYNEGTEEPTTASKITDYLPNGIKLVNVYYQNGTTPLVKDTDYKYDEDTNTVEITVLKNKDLIPVFDGGDTLSYDYVTVECEVQYDAEGILTNVAQISEYKTGDGVIPQDRDSYSNDWKNPVNGNSKDNETVDRDSYYWINYKGYIRNAIEEGKFKDYIGQQDDDDFEKIKVVELDLVLKKIITQVNDTNIDTLNGIFHRFQNGKVVVDTSYMNSNSKITTANYYLNKTPVLVAVNDKVTYQIRIYNEGSVDATASAITDYIPKGMVFESASYNGVELQEGTDYTIDNTTNNLRIVAMKDHLIPKYTGSQYNNVEPSYDYITVTCTVNGDVRGILTNVAEISKYQTARGELVIDRDSMTVGKSGEWTEPTGSNKNTLEGKSGSAWANYYSWAINTGKFQNYPGQEDDDDFEKVILATNYILQAQKVSALDNTKGLEGVDIKINNTSYTTNEQGYTGIAGPFELTTIQSLDTYAIEEVSTNNDNYVKLKNPIYIAIEKAQDENGYIYISGYRINLEEANFELATKSDLMTRTYYTYDLNDNLVGVTVKFSRVEQTGQMKITVVIENTIKDALFDIYVKKVDETGNDLDTAKFKIGENTVIETENGSAMIGIFQINKYNVDEQESCLITEIEAPSGYYKLKQPLELLINKGYNEDGTAYIVTSMKLINGEQTSEEGTQITLPNVLLEDETKKVNITAKLEGNTITITIPNIEEEFDLALRKFITKVNGENITYSREPQVNIDALKNGTATTATYEHTKEPLQVMASDTVEYSIRVYNEGPKDGYASLVMDDIPEGLEMIAPISENGDAGNVNAGYRWKMYKSTESTGDITYNGKNYVLTDNAQEAEVIVTDYLSKEQSDTNLLKGFDKNTMSELDYRDIKVEFKVKSTAAVDTVIINYAQITEDTDENGEDVTDRDSTPNEWIDGEDDQDIEKIIITREKEYDLALQKFITGVTTWDNTREITDREPKFSKDATVTNGDGYTYKPEFENLSAVEVNYNDIVTYTLRVYNEGEADAYAAEIADDIPDGVEFVPYTSGDGSINDTYRWVMYKVVTDEEIASLPEGTVVKELNGTVKDGQTKFEKCIITTDVKEADYIVSDYLSKEQGQAKMGAQYRVNPNLLKAFEPTTEEILAQGPDYRDVKIQFKVTYKATSKEESEREIINYAQITKETDRTGEDITDRDSTPNEWIDTDDDQDREKIRVKYFDLALVKWVSEAIIVEDGVERTEPGNKLEELENQYDHRLIYAMYPDTIGDYTDLEPVVKVDIPKSKLESTVVKFKYQIRVYNEGQIDGYAKEITDYIPTGMKFVQEDNPLWTDAGDGKVVTTQLADTLLTVGGEPQTVEIVYTWTNGEDNLGLIVNMAEISRDYNDSGTPDADSTPNNTVPGEDDIDDAAVLLSVRTGNTINITYVILAVSTVALIATGTILIKKFVL